MPLTAHNLEALLVVQAVDTDLDRARHRRDTLAERAELAAIDTKLAQLEHQLAPARSARESAGERQHALELNLEGTEKRAAEVKKRLYGGTVSATRDLQALSAELDSLGVRASDLESRVLEAMEEFEPLDVRVNDIEGEKGTLVADRVLVGDRLVARERDTDAEIESLNTTRAEAAAAVPPDLIATYERLRQRLGGVGAARLVGARCDGCHLTLPATALDQLRHQPPGTLTYCEQCGRILVPARP